MKKIILLAVLLGAACFCRAQVNNTVAAKSTSPKTNKSDSVSTFETIRNTDFSKLIGATAPGISFNYNGDKSTLNGSFTMKSYDKKGKYPSWIQLTPSLGTTTSISDLNSSFQPTFSIGASFIHIVKNTYFYDVRFPDNYDRIKGKEALDKIPTGFYADYSDSLRKNLQGDKPKYKKEGPLYTAKKLDWINIAPSFGGSKLSMYNSKAVFADQITNPYYWSYGLNFSFNHYYWLNNDDVHWHGFPTTKFFYYNLGLAFGRFNNTDALKKVSINDISSSVADSASKSSRQVFKTTNAFSGQLVAYTAVTPSFEVLYSFVRFFALDFFGNYNFITGSGGHIDNYGNVAGGVYFYTSTGASKVNFGLYYQHTVYTTPSKHLIGIKTKVPINW